MKQKNYLIWIRLFVAAEVSFGLAQQRDQDLGDRMRDRRRGLSMAIFLSELLGSKIEEHAVKIFATDIDAAALSHASKGVYSEAVVAPVPRACWKNISSPKGKVTASVRSYGRW